MLQQPDSSRIRQRDNLDHSAESACVRKWSSRSFAYERAIIDFIRRWHRFAAGQLATSSRNSASASTNSFPRQSNCSDLPAPRALARRPRSGSARCAGGVCRFARTRQLLAPTVCADAVASHLHRRFPLSELGGGGWQASSVDAPARVA